MRRIHLEETDSTNIYINKVEDEEVVVTTDFQTDGHGQGSNHWEGERGKNLLFSLKVSPTWLKASHYYLMSEIGALSLYDAVSELTDGITMKWPNDIYWKDRKLSGTLILTSISGKNLQNCIFGVGLNVNQREFKSDAPNPVSLWQILGKETDREALLQSILKRFEHYYEMLREGLYGEVALLYHENLYRKEGFFEYEDKDGRFEAEIVSIKENGHLILRDKQGQYKEYEFKEVKFII